MKTYLLQSLLLLFGITAAHGQVNLSDMAIDSSDSLKKSRIRYHPEDRASIFTRSIETSYLNKHILFISYIFLQS